MKIEQYYSTPPQKVFDDIKENAIKIWQTYDNEYGYVDEKVGRINNIKNFKDNARCIVGMFDLHNQRKLMTMVSKETADMIREAIKDGE